MHKLRYIMPHSSFRTDFIAFAIEQGVLGFGEFELKSGRISPYFFNAGLFKTGVALAKLGEHYAQAIVESGVAFDVLFGPAYKGIPLATTTAVALANQHGINVPYCFNRKEKKTHGEGGTLVGAPLEGRVLVIDDVITAGTAIRESMDIISANNATLAGVVVAINRQERGTGELSAIQEVERDYNTQVLSIASLHDLIEFSSQDTTLAQAKAQMQAYRDEYGV